MTEIKRQTELFICRKLRESLPELAFVPFHGGDDVSNREIIIPPFIVVSINTAEKTHNQESTWTLRGLAQVISHIDETYVYDHSIMALSVYRILGDIQPDATGQEFSFHGIDITDMSEAESPEAKAVATLIMFSAGVGG